MYFCENIIGKKVHVNRLFQSEKYFPINYKTKNMHFTYQVSVGVVDFYSL